MRVCATANHMPLVVTFRETVLRSTAIPGEASRHSYTVATNFVSTCGGAICFLVMVPTHTSTHAPSVMGVCHPLPVEHLESTPRRAIALAYGALSRIHPTACSSMRASTYGRRWIEECSIRQAILDSCAAWAAAPARLRNHVGSQI